MKKRKSGGSRKYFLLIIVLISLLMISSSFTMLANYSDMIEQDSGDVALNYTEGAANNLRSSIDAYKSKALSLVETINGIVFEDEGDFFYRVSLLWRDSRYGDINFIRLFNGDVEYDDMGNIFDSTMESSAVKKLVEAHVLACAGVVDDRQYNFSTVAFCIPIDGCEYADAMLVCYPVDSVVSYSAEYTKEDYSNSRFVSVCAPGGEIIRLVYKDEKTDVQLHGNIYETLRDKVNDKSTVDTLRAKIESGASDKNIVSVSGETCIISFSGIREYESTVFSVVGYYRSTDIYQTGYLVLRVVLGEFFVFFLLVISLGIFGVVETARQNRLIATLNDTNKVLGCFSRSKFERVAIEIISRNKATSFAVIVIDINHYDYILGQIGNEKMIDLLKHLKMLYNGILELDETLGYVENGRFVLLLHYREIENLAERLNPMMAIASHRSSQLTDSLALSLQGGIYTTDRNLTNTVNKMIDLAINAENATKFPCDFGVFRIYNETLYASSVQNDYIEVHMESALKNHDFKVFYQPKYNIAENCPDGCEALVRWYNPKLDEYMQPDVFLPLFEANRFIVKLDHYVFEQVCNYINDSILNGLPLYPVSVNASRITASEKDFAKFYIDMKRKYNIADGFVTIEFTESFAYEDYEMLRNTVNELHAGGFKCSIDDFGSGFSSYNILKELPMDEIKLDKFFIKNGYSHERDIKIISSVVALARELHMKITQEGVEVSEELEFLKKIGCQVIQGYYYSRPLALTDYIGFLSNEKKI